MKVSRRLAAVAVVLSFRAFRFGPPGLKIPSRKGKSRSGRGR